MSRLTDLLRQVRQDDTQLARDLEAEISELANRRTFGLVFEAHQPEAVELPGRRIRRGDKVRILAPRGATKTQDNVLWRVQRVENRDGRRLAHLSELEIEDPVSRTVSIDDLVVVAEFNDRIYPGLVETGRVERNENKPFHTVINAENYHALEMMTYTHRHAIDVIYIDPPYNTGAKDWKYNNDYVEGDDDYRHSKWLAFMERRLRIARELLSQDNSVLIVTIDEKEVNRLGLLLEQIFSGAVIQMVTTVIAPQGSQRPGLFSRMEEYVFFVFIGEAAVQHGKDPMIETAGTPRQTDSVWSPSWDSLLRRGTGATRADRPGMFYPVYVKDEKLLRIGESLSASASRANTSLPEGAEIIWPIRTDGTEGRWQVGSDRLKYLFERGYAKIGKKRAGRRSISYLKAGQINKLESEETKQRIISARSIWNKASHSAGSYGTTLLRTMLPGRRFPFPKSLYAVEDTLRFFVKDKPDAKILDFFAGSGTTAHAVMRLNKQDGGRRQSISVTNNEVSADEQRKLRKAGLRPGDPEWEALGICDYVTKPRVTAAITGKTPEGAPIKGDYRFTDEFSMADGFEENAAFFTLTYETPLSVRHHRAFERIAPMLWMKAGSQGRVITNLRDQGWDVAEAYAVLEDFDQIDDFIAALAQRPEPLVVYLITDDGAAFQMACRELADYHQPVRLYESYLHNFQLNLEGTL